MLGRWAAHPLRRLSPWGPLDYTDLVGAVIPLRAKPNAGGARWKAVSLGSLCPVGGGVAAQDLDGIAITDYFVEGGLQIVVVAVPGHLQKEAHMALGC